MKIKNNLEVKGYLNLHTYTTTELNSLTPTKGSIAYDETLGKLVNYDGTEWLPVDTTKDFTPCKPSAPDKSSYQLKISTTGNDSTGDFDKPFKTLKAAVNFSNGYCYKNNKQIQYFIESGTHTFGFQTFLQNDFPNNTRNYIFCNSGSKIVTTTTGVAGKDNSLFTFYGINNVEIRGLSVELNDSNMSVLGLVNSELIVDNIVFSGTGEHVVIAKQNSNINGDESLDRPWEFIGTVNLKSVFKLRDNSSCVIGRHFAGFANFNSATFDYFLDLEASTFRSETDASNSSAIMNNSTGRKYRAIDSYIEYKTEIPGTGFEDNLHRTQQITLNGGDYTLSSNDFGTKNTQVFIVNSSSRLVAPTGSDFSKYSYITFNYPTGSGSRTQTLQPGVYEVKQNNTTYNIKRVEMPKDSMEVVADGSGVTLTRNYNTTDAAGLEFDFDVVRLGSIYGYFTPDLTNNSITINKTGRYRVFYNLGHTSTGQRASLEAFITVNGTDIGTVRPRSYVRNTSGHTTDNIIDEEILSLSKDNVVQLRVRRAEGSTTSQAINMIKGSHLSIEWVSTNGI